MEKKGRFSITNDFANMTLDLFENHILNAQLNEVNFNFKKKKI